jgi:hypothetical protein
VGVQGLSVTRAEASMLTFDDDFHSDPTGCFLCAKTESGVRVRFNIGTMILQDELDQKGRAINDETNVALCKKERPRIEAACRHAFASRQSDCIDLQPSDFHAS